MGPICVRLVSEINLFESHRESARQPALQIDRGYLLTPLAHCRHFNPLNERAYRGHALLPLVAFSQDGTLDV